MTDARFIWRYALRRLRQSHRAGELRILALAIVVAVAASSAVGLFGGRMRAALDAQSGETLGADMLITSRDPIPRSLTRAAKKAQLKQTAVVSFPSLLISGEATSLAGVKAVSEGYPLLGELRVSDAPYSTVRRADGIPKRGEAWAEVRLWSELGLRHGDALEVGAITLKVTAVLEYEPDRGVGLFDLAPRLLMNHADVAASGLVGPTSRVQHGLMLAGGTNAIAALRKLPDAEPLRWTGPQEARSQVRRAIKRASQFLEVAVLAVALLAAAAIGLTAHQHGARLRDEVALLKCLGARQALILRALVLNLLLLGVIGALVGAAFGLAGQAILAKLLSGVIPNLILPPASAWAFASPAGLALLILIGFALPPIIEARRVPPIRVFQRAVGETQRTRFVWLAAGITVLALLIRQTEETELAAYVLGGALLAIGVLTALAWAMVAALTPLQRRLGRTWRFGIGNIARRRGSSVAQIVALGLGLLALLLVTVVREDLLDTWRGRLPPDTPNIFLINIQTHQLKPLRKFFAKHGEDNLKLWPMARARLVGLNGKPVKAEDFDDPETRRWINREFNLSWTDELGDDNRITHGSWWGKKGHGKNLLSIDEYGVERLNLKIGDRLTLQFGDREMEFTAHSFRTIDWDSFRPNFFLLVPPGVLEKTPVQWITSFHLPPEQRVLLRELTAEFSNITAIDIESGLNQVREIMDRVVLAAEFMLLFTLAAGIVVLLAAIEGTRSQRARETALLRALGARTPALLQGLLAEFLVVGLIAGVVAAVGAQVVAWVLAIQVFDISYGPRPALWLAGALAGGALVTLLGWLSLRGVLRTPPTRVLQSSM